MKKEYYTKSNQNFLEILNFVICPEPNDGGFGGYPEDCASMRADSGKSFINKIGFR